MNPCPPTIIVQTYVLALQAGQPVLIAKCAGGKMTVQEIACQLQSVAAANIQFFEGLPPAASSSLGSPLSQLFQMNPGQLVTVPGKTVFDDVFIVSNVTATVSVAVRIISGGAGGGAETFLSA